MFSVLFTFSLPRLPLDVFMSTVSQLPCQQDFLKLNKTQKLESESSQKTPDPITPLISQIIFFSSFSFGNIFSHLSAHPHPIEPERLLLKSKISLISKKKPLKLQSAYLYLLQEYETSQI